MNHLMISIGCEPARSSAGAWGCALLLMGSAAMANSSPSNIEGEVIDQRTGEVYWETMDVNIPGNGGLPLQVYRSFGKEPRNYFTLMRNWDLEIPRVVVPANVFAETQGNVSGLCKDPYPASLFTTFAYQTWQLRGGGYDLGPLNYYVKISSISWQYWLNLEGQGMNLGVKLIIPGQPVRTLVPKSTEASEFPGTITYVTPDNWTAECIATPNTNGRFDGFKITAPNGTIYMMDQIGRTHGDHQFNSYKYFGSNTAYVSEVKDLRGNTLNYQYEFGRNLNLVGSPPKPANDYFSKPSVVMPVKISASDGRTVDFYYEVTDTRRYYELFNFPKPREAPISKIVTNAGDAQHPGGQTWIYNYNGYSLASVTGPEGLVWNFEYNGPVIGERFKTSWISHFSYEPEHRYSINHLTKVTAPNGLTVDYTYNQRTGDFWGGENKNVTVFPINARRVSGPGLEAGTWTYITENDADYSYLEVQGPDNIRRGQHYRNYSGLNYAHLKSLTIYPSGATNAGSRTPLRSEVYAWTQHKHIGSLALIKAATKLPIALEYRTVLSQKTVNGTFTTAYSNFDSFGNPQTISETGTASRTTTRTYFNNPSNWIVGLLEDETVDGLTIDRTFNPDGTLQQINQYGIRESYEYYNTGDLSKRKWIKAGLNYEVRFESYFRGIAQSEIWPGNVIKGRGVNASGTIAWERNGRNFVTSFEYDNLNRLRKITPPSGHAETIIAWPSFLQRVTTKGNKLEETTSFNGLGQVLSTTRRDKSNARLYTYQSNAYNAAGRKTFASYLSDTGNEPYGTSYTYDGLGRLLTETRTANGGSHTRSNCYAPGCAGSTLMHGVQLTDARGYVTEFTHRSFGEPEQREVSSIAQEERSTMIDGARKVRTTAIDRNALGDIKTLTQGGVTRTYKYKPGTRLVKEIVDPENGTTYLDYDEVGNRKTRQVGTAGTTTYIYDDFNRNTYIDYPPGTLDVDFTYDNNGNLESSDTTRIRWDYIYNALDQLQQEKLTIKGQSGRAAQQYRIDYGFDALDNKNVIAYPSGRRVSLAPDVLGRPSQVGEYATNITYYANGQPHTLRFANGQQQTNGQNGFRLPETITTQLVNTVAEQLSYQYDPENNIASISDGVDTARNRTLRYDGLGRLTTVTGTTAAQTGTFTYDELDNIRSKQENGLTYIYNYNAANNRLTSITNTLFNFGYDGYGNITSNGNSTFAYDDANQLLQAGGITYQYDGSSQRTLTRTASGDIVSFYSRDGLLRLTRDTSTGLIREHVYLGHQHLASTTLCIDSSNFQNCGPLVSATVPLAPTGDADDDGMPNAFEIQYGFDPYTADHYLDADRDGLSNYEEYVRGSNPRVADAGVEDVDSDGMLDVWERAHGLNPRDRTDATADLDSDGLTNLQEYLAQTDPNNRDTDNDSILDGPDPQPTVNIPAVLNVIFEQLPL